MEKIIIIFPQTLLKLKSNIIHNIGRIIEITRKLGLRCMSESGGKISKICEPVLIFNYLFIINLAVVIVLFYLGLYWHYILSHNLGRSSETPFHDYGIDR